MRQTSDAYFVRLDHGPLPGAGPDAAVSGREGLGTPGRSRRRRRRRRPSGGMIFMLLLLAGLGSWLVWASQRPGGVSGTLNGWVDHVRGDVSKVSADPDIAKARKYFSDQYKANHAYPHLGEADLAGVGVGVGVTVEWCSDQAVVIQGQQGGGTTSRLLISGHDLGELPNRYDCPANLNDPSPWKASS